MRILLLSPLPPPVGGIASWTVSILNYYESSTDFKIIHQNTAIKSRDITKVGFYSRLISGVRDSFGILLNFLKLIVRCRPNVVHITSSGSMGLLRDLALCLICKIFMLPLVIHFRFGRIPEIYELNNWEWKIFSCVIKLSTVVIVLDDKSCILLKKLGYENIYNIPNPMSSSLEVFLADNEKYLSKVKKSKDIVFVGHVTKNKGVFELVKSFSLLDNINELLLIGPFESDIKNELIKLAGAKSDKIVFTGALDKMEVFNEMRKAAVLVLPSYTEGFPNVLIEAMAMQCPIIATRVGAVADMLNDGATNAAGLLIEPKNVKALIDGLDFMIANPDQAHFFAINAYSKVKNEYMLEKVCHQYEKIWLICTNRDR